MLYHGDDNVNVKNNKRRQESQNKIKAAMFDLLMTKSINEISVSDICKKAEINRSTFYANYDNLFLLAEDFCQQKESELREIVAKNTIKDFQYLFEFIQSNRIIYLVYLKLRDKISFHNSNSNNTYQEYKTVFFENGVYSIIRLWLFNGCVETPQFMSTIIRNEYDKVFAGSSIRELNVAKN